MTICTFVDPDDVERDHALRLAIAIAEHSLTENRTLFLLCDPITVVEIGLALLGSRTSRTLEGSEYRVSPIVLLPFLRGRRTLESEIVEVADEHDSGGGLADIYDLGVFAGYDEYDSFWSPTDDPIEVFEKIIAETSSIVIGLGSKSDLWESVYRASSVREPHDDQLIVDVEGFTPRLSFPFPMVKVTRNESAFVRRDSSSRDEQAHFVEEERQTEEQRGALLAALFEFLRSSLDRPTPSLP